MKVLYEISTLGLGHVYRRRRAGIFRYIESILEELTVHSDIECKFTSTTNFQSSIFSRQYLIAEKEEWLEKLIYFYDKNPLLTKLYLKAFNNIYKNQTRDIVSSVRKKNLTFLLDFLSFVAKTSRINEPFDIYHSFYNPFLPKSKISTKARIITIHDIIPLIHPGYFNKGYEKQFTEIIQSLNLREDWSICNSETTKKDFCKYSKMPEERVFVTPLAANPKLYPQLNFSILDTARQKYKIPEGKYILSLSTLEPRKNIAFVIKCFYKLLVENAIQDTYLVIAGAKGWLFDDIFIMAESQPNLLDKVIFTGYIEDEDLNSIYSDAICFIYLSFYEGFGLPPLEAMQCGVPVITSNTGSLPEVVGDAGIQVDPKDEDGLCQTMFILLTNTTLREDRKQKSLVQAQKFSWKKCASQTIDIYHKILESK